MPSSTVVHVSLSDRSYDIHIGAGILTSVHSRLLGNQRATHAVIVTDENVTQYAEHVRQRLDEAAVRVDVFSFPPGEQTKSVAHLSDLWMSMRSAGADRKTIVIAVGGGVIGDLAGFAAATYGRGVPFFQVPTTLLAQVDSSVGGKTGVNLPGAKNMVGCFWQPRGVLIDTDVLNTLPPRDYRAGLAEVAKYGVILDEPFFESLEANVAKINARDSETLANIIARCCELKAYVVQNDEREETGLRAILNYGHTFAHAIEAVAGYGEVLHGEAVSIGMVCASRLSSLLNRTDEAFMERQIQLLNALGLPTVCPALDRDALAAAMQKDKKTEFGKLRFILPKRMGEVELVGDVPSDLARTAFG